MDKDKTIELLDLVRRMRAAQKRAEARPTECQPAAEARDLERRVDGLLATIRQPSLFAR